MEDPAVSTNREHQSHAGRQLRPQKGSQSPCAGAALLALLGALRRAQARARTARTSRPRADRKHLAWCPEHLARHLVSELGDQGDIRAQEHLQAYQDCLPLNSTFAYEYLRCRTTWPDPRLQTQTGRRGERRSGRAGLGSGRCCVRISRPDRTERVESTETALVSCRTCPGARPVSLAEFGAAPQLEALATFQKGCFSEHLKRACRAAGAFRSHSQAGAAPAIASNAEMLWEAQRATESGTCPGCMEICGTGPAVKGRRRNRNRPTV